MLSRGWCTVDKAFVWHMADVGLWSPEPTGRDL